jgi:hypothetical protein
MLFEPEHGVNLSIQPPMNANKREWRGRKNEEMAALRKRRRTGTPNEFRAGRMASAKAWQRPGNSRSLAFIRGFSGVVSGMN